jgi:hypothetical protein
MSRDAGITPSDAVAIGIWRDVRATYQEDFQGFSLSKYDGTRITF